MAGYIISEQKDNKLFLVKYLIFSILKLLKILKMKLLMTHILL